MFFSSWQSLERVLVVGVLAYVSLVLLLRVFGKRTLSKMNAFDLIVTVALGSILATALLSKSVGLAEGLLAFGTLIGLQFVITRLSVRAQGIAEMSQVGAVVLETDGSFTVLSRSDTGRLNALDGVAGAAEVTNER